MKSRLLKRRGGLAVLTTVLWAAQATSGETAGRWKCLPGEAPVKLSGFLDDTDLSGIAMAGSFALVASDENAGIQLGTINAAGSEIQFTSQIPLAPSKKKKDGGGEIDMEGVCPAGPEKAFYVTGSHGVGKKNGDFQPLRCGIYRVPCDPEKGTILTAQISRSSLLPWLENSREFGTSVRQPLQQNGFNIEGIAHASGYLYFGVRAPSLDGRAFIIEVRADDLFRQQGLGITPRVHPVPLGVDTGIREIAAVAGGFLLLSGSAAAGGPGQDDSAFGLSFVPSAGPGQLGQPVRIADVTAPGGKAEGLLVLEDSAERIRILVLHDGLAQGGAAAYTLLRPASQPVPRPEWFLLDSTGLQPVIRSTARPMKNSAQILPFLLLLCGLVTAQESSPQGRKAAAAVTRIIPRLEDCPAAVRTALKMNGHDTRISEIKLTEEEGQKTYSFETGTEEDGADAEITYHYSGTGMLLKTEREIPLKEAPEKVQAALKKVAGPAAAVDDVEVVTAAGGIVYYRAELESNGGADRKVRVSPEGVILELIEEEDD